MCLHTELNVFKWLVGDALIKILCLCCVLCGPLGLGGALASTTSAVGGCLGNTVCLKSITVVSHAHTFRASKQPTQHSLNT